MAAGARQRAVEPLTVEGRVDHVALSARLEYELRLLTREQAWVRAI
jgi:hypothetical protein